MAIAFLGKQPANMGIPDCVHFQCHTVDEAVHDTVVKRRIQRRTSTGCMQDLEIEWLLFGSFKHEI